MKGILITRKILTYAAFLFFGLAGIINVLPFAYPILQGIFGTALNFYSAFFLVSGSIFAISDYVLEKDDRTHWMVMLICFAFLFLFVFTFFRR